MADVFLSYARADRDAAERLSAQIEASGHSVWWDRHIEGGAEFSKEIERQLDDARAVVVIWSKSGVESRWVRDEAGIGLEQGKLVAISLDGTQPPIGFKQIHAIDMTDASGQGDLLRALGHRLGGLEPVEHSAPAKSRWHLIAIPVILLFALAIGSWWYSGRPGDLAVAVEKEDVTAVAVLPFRSLSGDDNDRYFAEGVSQEILNRLGALSELRVTARTSSFQLAADDLQPSEIGAKLGVTHLVDGTVRRAGEDWRVTAQLVRAADGSQLWNDTYDVSGSDILAVQSEIAERAAEALGVLLDEEKRTQMADAGIDNPEAYALFAKGLELFSEEHNKGATYESLEEANSYFDRAFELEPRFWNAQMAAIDRYSHLLTDHSIGFPVGGPEVAEEARQEILRRLAEARNHAPRSAYPAIDQQAMQYSNDWTGARAVVRRMLANRESCNIYSSYDDWLVIRLGLVEEYLDYSRHKLECDPLASRVQYASMLLYADRTNEAIELIEGSEDRSEAMMRIHVVALLKAGRIEDAKDVLEGMDPSAYYYGQSQTWIYAAEGDLQALQGQYEFFENARIPDVARMHVASLMGDADLANKWAARIDARPGGPIWFANSGIVTCQCGNGFDIDATPEFKARLIEADASLQLRSPIDWPLQN